MKKVYMIFIPRAAYYALKEAHNLDPYAKDTSLEFINNYFDNLQIMDAVLRARGDKAALSGGSQDKLSISRLSAQFTTFTTGGTLLTTPVNPDPESNAIPDQTGFDNMESYFVGIEGRPTPNMRANVEFNIVGNVATNPINELFYENRARPLTVDTPEGEAVLEDNNRLAVYQAEYEWETDIFKLKGFYRTGHYHWQYEGDFFGLYPEANYGPNLDIYNGVISGFELDGKGSLDGLKAAFGPNYGGAQILLLYSSIEKK